MRQGVWRSNRILPRTGEDQVQSQLPSPWGCSAPPLHVHLKRGFIPIPIQAPFCLKSLISPLFNSSSSSPNCSQGRIFLSPPPPSSSWEHPYIYFANPLPQPPHAPHTQPGALQSPTSTGPRGWFSRLPKPSSAPGPSLRLDREADTSWEGVSVI